MPGRMKILKSIMYRLDTMRDESWSRLLLPLLLTLPTNSFVQVDESCMIPILESLWAIRIHMSGLSGDCMAKLHIYRLLGMWKNIFQSSAIYIRVTYYVFCSLLCDVMVSSSQSISFLLLYCLPAWLDNPSTIAVLAAALAIVVVIVCLICSAIYVIRKREDIRRWLRQKFASGNPPPAHAVGEQEEQGDLAAAIGPEAVPRHPPPPNQVHLEVIGVEEHRPGSPRHADTPEPHADRANETCVSQEERQFPQEENKIPRTYTNDSGFGASQSGRSGILVIYIYILNIAFRRQSVNIFFPLFTLSSLSQGNDYQLSPHWVLILINFNVVTSMCIIHHVFKTSGKIRTIP